MGLFRSRKSSSSAAPTSSGPPEPPGFPALSEVRGTLVQVREEAGLALAQAGVVLEADIAGSVAAACPQAPELPVLLGASGFAAGLFKTRATTKDLAQLMVHGRLRLPMIQTWSSGMGVEFGRDDLRISVYAFRNPYGTGAIIVDTQPDDVDSDPLLDLLFSLEDDAGRAGWLHSVAHRGYGRTWLADAIATCQLIEAEQLIDALLGQLKAGS